MPYLGATEISLTLPANVSIGTNTSPLSLSEVASIIAETGARFDLTAGGVGWAVPVSSAASAWPAVQQIVRDGAVSRVLDILFFPTRTPTAEQMHDSFEKALAAITDGTLDLPGVPMGGALGLLPRSYSTSYTGEDGIEQGASVYISRSWEP